MLRGPEPGRHIPLDGDVLLIGRGRKNDIIIQDNEVSRTHCRLVRVLEDYEIHDLSSTNGTLSTAKRSIRGGGYSMPIVLLN
ncbi:MAG: FHA domain-containing protein [Anaerolineae bacterium]|nr:FHA domain-containing protein [Anaerolineae bacterium]